MFCSVFGCCGFISIGIFLLVIMILVLGDLASFRNVLMDLNCSMLGLSFCEMMFCVFWIFLVLMWWCCVFCCVFCRMNFIWSVCCLVFSFFLIVWARLVGSCMFLISIVLMSILCFLSKFVIWLWIVILMVVCLLVCMFLVK